MKAPIAAFLLLLAVLPASAAPAPADPAADYLEILDFETLRRPERDPLFWTGLLGDATIFLLVREDLPKSERLQRAAARADLVPRLARQAREALGGTAPSGISPEICPIFAPRVDS